MSKALRIFGAFEKKSYLLAYRPMQSFGYHMLIILLFFWYL